VSIGRTGAQVGTKSRVRLAALAQPVGEFVTAGTSQPGKGLIDAVVLTARQTGHVP
jgi:hypothetical protein